PSGRNKQAPPGGERPPVAGPLLRCLLIDSCPKNWYFESGRGNNRGHALENVGILTAFLFGFLSFISPCVLPIVPGYLSFISGVSFDEMQNTDNRSKMRNRIIFNSIFFIAGFSLVFILLGASATAVGEFLHAQIG